MTELTSVTADQLKGVDIYDQTDAKIAEIADLVIGSDDKVTGIVTDVGGFLGMGEHRISLGPDQVAIYKNADNDIRAYVSMTKDELKALPKYEAPNQ
ncbi:PRC-barrel domain protein [Paracoccus sulfuroxidans]|uniref:PRC-barrel domain protein n=2 Tax=Paracoccus sulfuroxidans TaxID=384678 RepID=A0A562N7Y6_9RHOB|nr:PRC-barrel domain protein [Paracoccus sulfuroxidans]